MNNPRIPVIFFLFLLLLGLLQWVNVYPQLPNRVACHFAADGTPNGWQPKQDFFLIPGFAIALCIFVSFVLPRILAFLPPAMINLPNKYFWLAPERRAETIEVMNAHLAWFGCGFLFVILYAISQAINANLPARGQFNGAGMIFVIAAFCLYSGVVFAHMLRYFLRVPPSNLTA
jgi:uncharacterized membrane protein